jgi:hypothetical protein
MDINLNELENKLNYYANSLKEYSNMLPAHKNRHCSKRLLAAVLFLRLLKKIEFYKSEQKRYEQLCKHYPNDFDFKREMYGYASKVFALEWVLSFKNGS